jgi:hypothetical protein
VSLDFAQAHPGHPLRYARSKPSLESSFPLFGAIFEPPFEKLTILSVMLALAFWTLMCTVSVSLSTVSIGLLAPLTDSSGLFDFEALVFGKCLTVLESSMTEMTKCPPPRRYP